MVEGALTYLHFTRHLTIRYHNFGGELYELAASGLMLLFRIHVIRYFFWLQRLDFAPAYSFATSVLIALVLTKIKVKASLTIYEGLDRGLIVWRSHLLWQAAQWWRQDCQLYGRAAVYPQGNSFVFLSVRGGMRPRDTEFEHYWPTWKIFLRLRRNQSLHTSLNRDVVFCITVARE